MSNKLLFIFFSLILVSCVKPKNDCLKTRAALDIGSGSTKVKIAKVDLCKKVIIEKDAVILAEVKRSKCDYIITLDKKDFLQQKVFKFIKPKKILTPKMFFEMISKAWPFTR